MKLESQRRSEPISSITVLGLDCLLSSHPGAAEIDGERGEKDDDVRHDDPENVDRRRFVEPLEAQLPQQRLDDRLLLG